MSYQLNKDPATQDRTTVTALLVSAFTKAAAAQRVIHERWINASIRVGGLLPTSILMMSVQSIGHLDMVIRMMENEFSNSEKVGSNDLNVVYALNYQRLLSELWIGSAYEVVRLLRERELEFITDDFNKLMNNLELLRIPLEKHEIAKDKKLDGPLIMQKVPAEPNDVKFIYDKTDKRRAHIMQSGISDRGSYMWSVIDIKAKTERWIEWRTLSDSFLNLFAAEPSGK